MNVGGMRESFGVHHDFNRNTIAPIGEKASERKYVLGALAPKNNSHWKGPWDCAEFVSWLVFQSAGRLYGCNKVDANPSAAEAFTGFWARDAKAMGRIISLEQAARTPGAAVLRMPKPGAIGHIVISDGKGGTVEAHSSARGVIAHTLSDRRWDMGILVPYIQYQERDGSSVTPPWTTIFRLTEPHMRGPKVKEIQQRLKSAGYHPGSLDGVFGAMTHAAVLAFQISRRLLPDGEVGPQTARMLGIRLEVSMQ
jgi:N-acetylmuramoyl-L-alanine amidase